MMNYLTEDFKNKISELFPPEKARELMNEFNSKLKEEEEALQEIGFTGDWTYRNGKTEINATVTRENNTQLNLSIKDDRNSVQNMVLTKNALDSLMYALIDLNKKINPYKMTQARSRLNILNNFF